MEDKKPNGSREDRDSDSKKSEDERARKGPSTEDEEAEEAAEDTFPASDPPAW